ncbi:MAG: GAF domain-containing protein [Bacteroidales bacterium]|nr:GAF domain-containing protein [Bacteroidales bacterium]MBN2756906.1 GAF domain-containing protein [Bacteroidales bacterium]
MKIRAKIFLFIFISSFIVFAIVIGVIVFRYKNYAIKDAKKIATTYAYNAANQVKSALEHDIGVSKTLSLSFLGYDNIPSVLRKSAYNDMLKNVLIGHPEYLSVWMSWELQYVKKGYNKPYGRERTATLKESGNITFYVDTVETDGDNLGSLYYKQKITGDDLLTDPYYYVYSKTENADSILETSIATPIIKNGEFIGISGIDITLNRFQNIIEQIKPFKDSYAFLISNNGVIVSYPNEEHNGDSLIKIYPQFKELNTLEKIREGRTFSFNFNDSLNYSNFVTFAPIKVGRTKTPWSMCLIAPSKIVEEEALSNFNISLLIGFIGILIFSLFTLFIAQRITSPLHQSTLILKDLDKGIIDFSKKLKVRSKDELAEMGNSLNKLMDTLSNTANFAKKVGQGDFTAKYTALSKHDVLGNALIDMQNNLQKSQEQEDIRILEQKKSTWAQEGISILGETLRKSTDDYQVYLFNIISTVVNYLNADQGGIFIYYNNKDEAPYLELVTAYAYDKKKALNLKVEPGESLVGRCFKEKELIYLNDIPEGYTFISSGLGEHEPKSLVLLPLIFENEVFGVIEIASFNEILDFEFEFLRNAGERIASSISVLQKTIETRKLLEQSQIQSEKLQDREKALQDNLINLQKAQEEAATREKETAGIIDAISAMASVVWYDLEGKIINIIDPNLEDAGLSAKEMIGHFQSEFAPETESDPKGYKRFWNDLNAGKTKERLFKTETSKGTLWISETYVPIKDVSGNPDKVINIGFNITKQKELEKEIYNLQKELKELKDKFS